MKTLLVKRLLVMIRTEELEHWEFVKLAQQGINLTIQTLLVKRYLVIRTEQLDHWEYVKLAQQGIHTTLQIQFVK